MMGTAVPPTDVEKAQPEMPASQKHANVARSFAAMMKKEFRALVAWAVALLVIYGGIVAMAVYVNVLLPHQIKAAGNGLDPTHFILSEPLAAISVTGCPVIALLIGVLQYIYENSPDRYAFLTHRPMNRARIFWAKTLVGFLVYLAVAALPLITVLLWASSSSLNRYPFLWDMTLPTLADIAAGFFYYFAGVLLIVRVWSDWLGSRALPLVVPLIGSAIALEVKSGIALAYLVVAAIPLVIAACGAFYSYGQIRLQSWIARLSLGLVIVISIYLIAGFALGIADGVTRRYQTVERSTEYRLLSDGRIVRVRHDGTYGNDSTQTQTKVETLNGQPLDSAVLRSEDYHPSRTLMDPMPRLRDQWLGWSLPRRYNDYLYGGKFFTDQRKIQYGTYRPRDLSYMILYDETNHKMLGSVGRNGFEPNRIKPTAPFELPIVDLNGGMFLSGNAVYQFDGASHVVPIFVMPDGLAIAKYSYFLAIPDYGQKSDHTSILMLATAQHIYRINIPTDRTLGQKLELTEESPCEPGKYILEILWKPDQKWFATRYFPDGYRLDNKDQKQFAMIRESDGTIRRVDFPLGSREVIFQYHYAPFDDATSLVTPLGFVAGRTAYWLAWYRSTPYWWYMDTKDGYLMHVGGITLGVLSTVAMWWMMSRQQFARKQKMVWALIALFGGPPTILVRLVIVPSSVMEKCPDCQKKRPVGLGECPHCHKPWPEPARDGREIFAG